MESTCCISAGLIWNADLHPIQEHKEKICPAVIYNYMQHNVGHCFANNFTSMHCICNAMHIKRLTSKYSVASIMHELSE